MTKLSAGVGLPTGPDWFQPLSFCEVAFFLLSCSVLDRDVLYCSFAQVSGWSGFSSKCEPNFQNIFIDSLEKRHPVGPVGIAQSWSGMLRCVYLWTHKKSILVWTVFALTRPSGNVPQLREKLHPILHRHRLTLARFGR